jgi:collagen beta-1,O-galactosyltransferase
MIVFSFYFSNFWGEMKDYYYVRSEDYKDILDWKKTGCFQVPLIHSATLMNVRKHNLPNFQAVNETIPEDDIIRFAISAQSKGIQMEVCNDIEYGFILSPLEDEEPTLYSDNLRLNNLRVEIGCKTLSFIYYSSEFAVL